MPIGDPPGQPVHRLVVSHVTYLGDHVQPIACQRGRSFFNPLPVPPSQVDGTLPAPRAREPCYYCPP